MSPALSTASKGPRFSGKFREYTTGETSSEMSRSRMVLLRVPGSGRHGVLGMPLQTGPDEVLDVAVQHVVGVVPHGAGAVILDVLLVQHVAADLRAPLDGLLLAARLELLLEPPLLLALEQPRAQHRHGLLAVLDLRLAVLDGDDDLLRRAAPVDHAYGRVGGVDRLPPWTTGAVHVH